MTAVLSETDAATRITSVWKGFKVRTIFSKMDKVNSWELYDEIRLLFDEKISKSHAHSQFLLAWEIALDKTDHRLWKEENSCYCQKLCGGVPDGSTWDYPDDDPSDPGDWMWNEGGYCDW